MYQDLKSKLELYKSGAAREIRKQDEGRDVCGLIPGRAVENDNGSCYLIENVYSLGYLHGGIRLGELKELDLCPLKRVFPDIVQGLSIDDFLFLDTETTGLSGGAGTVAFLVGVGFFTDEGFVLRQYFMRDYDEEAALLTELNGLMKNYRGLVTFNGKGFDWNLLASRYVFNRIKPAMKNPVHMDLLFPSRRIWKLKLESCRLVSLEENILSEYRVDDIPGALIPSVYFKYVEDRDATQIAKVITHNTGDILSMLSLLAVIGAKLARPSENADDEELYGLGRIFEDGRELELVTECYESCARSEGSRAREAAVRRLSGIYKRTGDYDKAVRHWENMLASGEALSIFPLVELAKYYEHRVKDISRAIDLVEKAIEISSRMGIQRVAEIGELKKRYDRLRRKAGRVNNA